MATTYPLANGAADWWMFGSAEATFDTTSVLAVIDTTDTVASHFGMCFTGLPAEYSIDSAKLRFCVHSSGTLGAVRLRYANDPAQTPPGNGAAANGVAWTTYVSRLDIGWVSYAGNKWIEVNITSLLRTLQSASQQATFAAHLNLQAFSEYVRVHTRDSGTSLDPELVLELSRPGMATLSASAAIAAAGRSSTVMGGVAASCAAVLSVKGFQSNIRLAASPALSVGGWRSTRHRGNGAAVTGYVLEHGGRSHVLTEPASCRWASAAGPLSAEIQTPVQPSLLSTVRLFGERGIQWAGYVWQPARNRLQALGSHVALTMQQRAARYADAALQGAYDPYAQMQNYLRASVGEDGFVWALDRGLANYSGWYGSIVLEIAATSACTVTFDWERPTAQWRPQVFMTSSSKWEVATHPSAEDWTMLGGASLTLAGGTITQVRFSFFCEWDCSQSAIDASGRRARFHNIRVHTEGMTTVTPGAVLARCCEQLPAWADARTERVDAGTAVIDELSFPSPARLSEHVQAALQYEQHMSYQWLPTWVGLRQETIPVYEPAPTGHQYRDMYARADDGDAETVPNSVLVGYTDANGMKRWARVDNTDQNNPVTAAGRMLQEVVDVDTIGSEAAAVAYGTAWLARRNALPKRATVQVSGVRAAHGQRVPIGHLRCDRSVLLEDGSTARIVAMDRSGSFATLTLDTAPYSLDTALAKGVR